MKFDRSAYNRDFSIESDQTKEQWVAAEPADFQVDGEIVAEVGSTLADDDDAKMTKAQNILQVAMTSGGQLNVRQALTDYLIAQGMVDSTQMGALGWSTSEVDVMEPWQVARFLGDDGFDPVIRGSRGLVIPSDSDDDEKGPKKLGKGSLRSRMANKGRELGRVLSGDDAR